MRYISLVFVVGLLSVALVGCKSADPEQKIKEDRERVEKELGGEISLQEDRSALGELRREIPAETQKSNDELALYLNLMKQGREKPQDVRIKFQSLLYKRRSIFRAKVSQLRDSFRKEESGRRDEFMAQQKSKRSDFLKTKPPSGATRDFFSSQEKERLSFFADERGRRQNFESEITARSKDFDSYMRERQKEFDEQFRIYSKQFSERPKDKNAVTGEN